MENCNLEQGGDNVTHAGDFVKTESQNANQLCAASEYSTLVSNSYVSAIDADKQTENVIL